VSANSGCRDAGGDGAAGKNAAAKYGTRSQRNQMVRDGCSKCGWPDLPRFFAARVSNSGSAGNTCVCKRRDTRGVAEPPRHARPYCSGLPSRLTRSGRQRYSFIEFQTLSDFECPSLQVNVNPLAAQDVAGLGPLPDDLISNSALFMAVSCCVSSSASESASHLLLWHVGVNQIECSRRSMIVGELVSCQLRTVAPRLISERGRDRSQSQSCVPLRRSAWLRPARFC